MKEQTDRNNEQTDRKSEQTDRKSEQTDRKSELTDRRKKLQGVLKDLPVVVGIYFLLVAGLTVLRPFYLKSLNRDITLTIVATGEKQEASKSNYVRLSHIAVNGRDINLAQVKIDEGSLWTYDSLNDYLRVYEFEDPQSITVQLKDVHSLKVGMVSEVGSGIAEILIDGEMRERVDLFKNADWDTYWFRYDSSVFVFPERHLWLQILTLFLISFSCFLWNRKRRIPKKVCSACTWTVLCAFLSVLILTGISLIQYDDGSVFFEYLRAEPQSFLRGAVFIFLALISLSILFNRIWPGFLITALFLDLLCVVSNVKLLNRGMPLLPWDYTMALEAAGVAGNYEISMTAMAWLVTVEFLLVGVLLMYVCKEKLFSVQRSRRMLLIRFVLCLCFAALAFLYVRTSFIDSKVESNDSEYRVYRVNDYYRQRGFLSAFLEYCYYFVQAARPEGYGRERMDEIATLVNEKIGESGQAKGVPSGTEQEPPVMIAVMSESFWDITRTDTITFDEDVIPCYRALCSEAAYGELFSHVFSGGTVVSEFEFLTGFSGEFFPEDYMVYGSFIDDGFSTVVSDLEAQGYSTAAMHPYTASNYNRENAYRRFGFDELYFEEAFEMNDPVRGYVSDAELFSKIISQYEKKKEDEKGQFIFAVTMQNHGGYWERLIYEPGRVGYQYEVYGETARGSIDDFVAGLHEADRALGELIDYFRTVDREVVVIFFGDHVSNAGPKDDRMLEKTSWHADPLLYDCEIHKVPFLVWSNSGKMTGNMGLMGMGELFPVVMEKYGLSMAPFRQYVALMKDAYGASDSQVVVGTDGSYAGLSAMNEGQRQAYETFRLLQYDYVWGKRYAAELMEIQFLSDSDKGETST